MDEGAKNMTTWGLVIETTMGVGERKHTEAYVLAHVTGEHEEALAELERRARSYSPRTPEAPSAVGSCGRTTGSCSSWTGRGSRSSPGSRWRNCSRTPPHPRPGTGGGNRAGA
ncbi:hypothetical protein ACR6C2_20555 [Streptomyces sp. INA 01156]